jgi:hypothetical protein
MGGGGGYRTLLNFQILTPVLVTELSLNLTIFYLFIFLVGLEFELRSSRLQCRRLYHLSHTSSPFCSGYFGDGGLSNYLPVLASNLDPPTQLQSPK